MDKHLKDIWKEVADELDLHSYITPYDENDDTTGVWYIRHPGATRGRVQVNEDMKILSITLTPRLCYSPELGCYKESLKGALDKFIGTTLELEEYEA